MNEPLFRPEVLQARRQDWLGQISLAQPLPLWAGAAFAAFAATAVLALLVFGEYTRRSRVGGQLVPDLGLSTVVAPATGVVASLTAEEGAAVSRGQPLARVEVPRVAGSGSDVRRVVARGLDDRAASGEQLASAQKEQLAIQAQGQRRQLATLRTELGQVRAGIATRAEQVRLGRETADRYREVAASGYVSLVQLRQQEQAALELLNAQQVLERQATVLLREIGRLEQSLAELPVQQEAAAASARREQALLMEERLRHEADGGLLVEAPVAGVVANRYAEPGQSVQAGQPLMSVLPRGARLLAQLQVPSRAVGFIRPGDRVQLRYQAYPYQKFGHQAGHVLRISRSSIAAPQSTSMTPAEPYYRVLVELDRQSVRAYGNTEPLRPGMLLDADILGERRRLYEWLLEPLYSLRGLDADGRREG